MRNQDEIEKLCHEVVGFVKGDPAGKYICKHHWMSGSSTDVAPITIWMTRPVAEVVFQWDSRNTNTVRHLIRRIREVYGLASWFTKNDGSCPATFTVSVE